MPYGVGLIGAGPGVEALHLPTLDRLAARLRAVHVANSGSGRAARIAEARGIRSSAGVAGLLADPAVEVVALCSPPARHAEHVRAAVAAGKTAILVEKPLALTAADADDVVATCRAAGVALVVGTNHLFDPAWGRAKHHLLASGAPVRTLTVSVALAPNHPLHAAVTEMVAPAPAPARSPGGGPDLGDPRIAAGVVRQLVTGLLVHDLPLVRDLAPDLEEVVFARALAPVGAAIGFRASGVLVQLAAVLVPSGADPEWRLTATTDAERIDIRFPPSFVHAGAAEVSVTGPDGRRTTYPPDDGDGYLAEWEALADLVDGRGEPEWSEIADDARYAVQLAEAAADRVGSDAGAVRKASSQRAGADAVVPEAHSTRAGADAAVRAARDPEADAADSAARDPQADAAGDRAAGSGPPGHGDATPVGVVAADEGFRVAAAGLPRGIRPTADPRGAIVAGRTDPQAAAVVLRAPIPAGPPAASAVPLVVVRPFLRPDVALDAVAARAGVTPRLVVAECAATGDRDPVLADTIGWLRVLAGAPLRLVAAERTPSAALVAFDADGVTAPLTVTFGAPRPAIRVRALGETTTEVTIDHAGRAHVTTATAAGTVASPRRWESPDRLALRRAVAALTSGAPDAASPADAAELAHDAAHAASVIAPPAPAPGVIDGVDPGDRRPGVADPRRPAETGTAGPREDRR